MRCLYHWVPLALALLLALPVRAADCVVIVVLDGLRSTEGFGDPEARFIPRMAHELAPQGALALACDNNGWTITVSGHATIAAGRYQYLNNDGLQRPYYPLLWEYYRDETGADGQEALVVATKTKIKILSYSSWTGYGPPDSARILGPTYDDAATVDLFLDDMQANRPVVSMLNLGNIDMAGHTGVWSDYTAAIARADSLVQRLWTEIQADPFYADRTAMVVTGDHGRHADGYGDWSGHGDDCPGCRRISLLALGPDFLPGTVSEIACEQIDLCKTIGSILGIPTPLAHGRILGELLYDPAEIEEERETETARLWWNGGSIRMAVDPTEAPFDLALYDLSGRRVAGRRFVEGGGWTWTAPTSGVLFYRVISSRSVYTGRLVMIR